jgi:hypothetical protein
MAPERAASVWANEGGVCDDMKTAMMAGVMVLSFGFNGYCDIMFRTPDHTYPWWWQRNDGSHRTGYQRSTDPYYYRSHRRENEESRPITGSRGQPSSSSRNPGAYQSPSVVVRQTTVVTQYVPSVAPAPVPVQPPPGASTQRPPPWKKVWAEKRMVIQSGATNWYLTVNMTHNSARFAYPSRIPRIDGKFVIGGDEQDVEFACDMEYTRRDERLLTYYTILPDESTVLGVLITFDDYEAVIDGRRLIGARP